MPRNLSPSTMSRIGDITGGVHVKTSTIANTVALASAEYTVFNVVGRIRIVGMDIEAVTAFAADATIVKWRFENVLPDAVASADISANALSCASLTIGGRVMWRGTAVATAPDVNLLQASFSVVTDWMDVGRTGGTGKIHVTSSIAAQSSGTCRFNLYYFPISDGAYAEAAV